MSKGKRYKRNPKLTDPDVTKGREDEWPLDEKIEAIYLYTNGQPEVVVSAKFGRAPGAARCMIWRVFGNYHGYHGRELCEYLRNRMDSSTSSQTLDRELRPWNKNEISCVRKFCESLKDSDADPLEWEDVAMLLRRTVGAVKQKCQELRLVKRPGGFRL